tara:strand:+ start:110 stop:472 length:363 start_codon:yes stop_codon:yes gene_type:complete
MFNAVSNIVIEYNHKGEWSYEGDTAEEIYETLNFYGRTEKPSKDEFIAKLEAEHQRLNLIELRKKRNKLLAESDWTQISDVVLANKDEWKTYRQALRDLPSTFVNGQEVIFPNDPNYVEP